MQADPGSNHQHPLSQWPPRLLARLACPVCHGALRIESPDAILCTACLRHYPILDGIPVLIAERATGGEALT
ncbi:MAG: Trm112 family protein [Terracidiphilus sp.]